MMPPKAAQYAKRQKNKNLPKYGKLLAVITQLNTIKYKRWIMKKWCVILEEEKEALKAFGGMWALGYLAVLRLKTAGRGQIKTSVRELAREFGLADFRAVKRVLNALAAAGIIALEQGPKGTFIKLLSLPENGRARDMEKTVGQSPTCVKCENKGFPVGQSPTYFDGGVGTGGKEGNLLVGQSPTYIDTDDRQDGQIREFDGREQCDIDRTEAVGQNSAQALGETQQSVEQSATPAPFPSYSPIPTNETNINKRQEKHVYIKAAQAAQEKKSSPQKEKLRAFADKVALKFESFENQAQKNVWFYRNYKNLRDILAYGGSEQMGLLTIQACAEMLEAKGYSGGYGAVCRNLPLYYEKAKRMSVYL